jgi:hypothetical protein
MGFIFLTAGFVLADESTSLGYTDERGQLFRLNPATYSD